MNRGELKNPVRQGFEWTRRISYETTIHLFDMMRFQFGVIEEPCETARPHQYPEMLSFR